MVNKIINVMNVVLKIRALMLVFMSQGSICIDYFALKCSALLEILFSNSFSNSSSLNKGRHDHGSVGYLILISIDSYILFSIFCLVSVLTEKINYNIKHERLSIPTLKKPLEVHQKYFTAHGVFNSLLSVWKCSQT